MDARLLLLFGLVACSAEVVEVDADGAGGDGAGQLDPLTEAVAPPGVPTWGDRATRGSCGWDHDIGVDGSIDEVHLIQAQPNGDTLELHDYEADGIVDSIVRTVVDERGLIVRRESGSPTELSWVYSFGNDADGRRTSETVDQDGAMPPDGIPNYEHTYAYDERGRLASIESVNHDSAGLTTFTSYQYDEDGLGYLVTRDWPSLFTDAWSLELDAAGRLTRREVDYGADNLGNNSWTYTYDAAGRRDRMIANIGDGPRHFIYGYDAEGRLSTIDFDHPAGGAIESRYTFHYDCD